MSGWAPMKVDGGVDPMREPPSDERGMCVTPSVSQEAQCAQLTSCCEMASQTEHDPLRLVPSPPCDPGTFLYLEGVVWHETQDGVLVVNITWRGRNYVGTLLDHTKYDWAGTSYTDVSEEKRSSKARGVSYCNSGSNGGYSNPSGAINGGKRNIHSALYNSSPSSATVASPPQNSSSSSSSSSSCSSSGVGGRTTNNSIAAEYDANSKIRVHAVSPLVGGGGSTAAGSFSNGANTPSQPPGASSAGVTVAGNLVTGKAKRSCNLPGRGTPPPGSSVEEQGNPGLGSSTGGSLKRKSEKHGLGSDQACSISENKTGKKPRVTITNIGANNETLTTVLNTTLPLDNLWKCSEPSCSKKYKHKNGLRYHITHAHNKSESEADVIIENEMTSHYAQITIASTPDSSANGEEEFSESGKMTSPKGGGGSGGKKSSSSRKGAMAKEKKKRRESDDSPANSELGSSHGSNDYSESPSISGNGSSNSTPPMTCGSPSSTATVKSSSSSSCSSVSVSTSAVNDSSSLVPKTTPSNSSASKISRLGGASSSVPLQQTDPAQQPERKVAKVAPTSFGGGSAISSADSSKYKSCNSSSQHLDSTVKLEVAQGAMMNPQGSSKSYKPQNSHFHVPTPIYPFGPVDPKLYTNFVAPAYAAHSHADPSVAGQASSSMGGLATSESASAPLNPNSSPKPEGTAARIVHQQHNPPVGISTHHQGPPISAPPGGAHGNAAPAGSWPPGTTSFMQQGSTGVHHITSAPNNPNVHASFVDNPATKFVEANAQHIAEATVQAVSAAAHHHQQQAPPCSPHSTPAGAPPVPPQHHVHNHIHNYVAFPPPPHSHAHPQMGPPHPPQMAPPRPQQQQQPPPHPSTNLLQCQSPPSGHAHSPLDSPYNNSQHTAPVPCNSSSNSNNICSPPQFTGSIGQGGRPLAPVSPFNTSSNTCNPPSTPQRAPPTG